MTAPALTPDELIRSRAFFEAAEFAEIVEHADDVIHCKVIDCGAPATLRVLCIACRVEMSLSCTECYEERIVIGAQQPLRCPACGHKSTGLAAATVPVPL